MQKLEQYLAGLKSGSNAHGIYVDRNNIDNFRIGSRFFKNGGFPDEFVFAGSLDELSCGYHCESDALMEYLTQNKVGYNRSSIIYQGKKTLLSMTGVYDSFVAETLDSKFEGFLRSVILEICFVWAQEEARLRVEAMKDFLLNLSDS